MSNQPTIEKTVDDFKCKGCKYCQTLLYEHNGKVATRLCGKWAVQPKEDRNERSVK